jgi:hypothetical protein
MSSLLLLWSPIGRILRYLSMLLRIDSAGAQSRPLKTYALTPTAPVVAAAPSPPSSARQAPLTPAAGSGGSGDTSSGGGGSAGVM